MCARSNGGIKVKGSGNLVLGHSSGSTSKEVQKPPGLCGIRNDLGRSYRLRRADVQVLG